MSKVAVIGAGAYGTALGGVLAENGYDIDYYDPLKERERLKDVVDGAAAIVLAIPSDVIMKLLSHLPKNRFLVVASKGFLTTEPFEEFSDWAVLSGAGFADDIKAGKVVRLTATDQRVAEMFGTKYLDFEVTDDQRGVLMCGALKNIYALVAGKRGLKPGSKRMKAFLREAVNEMGMILEENGAKLNTLRLACGVKDLILTCGLNSRNYSFGLELRINPQAEPSATVEGVMALKRIKRGEIKLPDRAEIIKQELQG